MGERIPPPDKSISHRAALIAAMAEELTGSRAISTPPTPAQPWLPGAPARGGSDREPDGGWGASRRRYAASVCPGRARSPATARSRSTSGTRAPCSACCRGGSRGRAAARGHRRRRLDPPPARRPRRRAAVDDGRERELSRRAASPLRVEGLGLAEIEYRLPVASAQVKSCVLLAGLLADGATTVVEPADPRPHRAHARRGRADLRVDETTVAVRVPPARRIEIRPADRLAAGEIEVPGDFSSAAFLIVAAGQCPEATCGSETWGSTRRASAYSRVLHRMGAAAEVEEDGASGGASRLGACSSRPPEGDARRRPRGSARDRRAPARCPSGLLRRGADGGRGRRARHKESDRIAGVVDGLRGLGAEIESRPDGFAVEGGEGTPGRRTRRPRRPPPRDARRDRRTSLARRRRGRRNGVRRPRQHRIRVGPGGVDQHARRLRWPSPGHGVRISSTRGVLGRADLAALVRVELGEQAQRPAHGFHRDRRPRPAHQSRRATPARGPGARRAHRRPGAGSRLPVPPRPRPEPPAGGPQRRALSGPRSASGGLYSVARVSGRRRAGHYPRPSNGDRDRRPRRPASPPRASPTPSTSRTSTRARCTDASRSRRCCAGADLDDGEALEHLSAGVEIELGGATVLLTGRTSPPQCSRGRSGCRGLDHLGRGDGGRQRADQVGWLRRRGQGYRHGGQSRRSAQGVPDGERRKRARRRATESRALFEDVVESQRERDLRDREREHSPRTPPTTPSSSTPPGSR